ncbi:MAG TPA: sugar transferase [Terracidiphilus sp.]
MNRSRPQASRQLQAVERAPGSQEDMEIASTTVRESTGPRLLKLHLFWRELSPWSRSALKRFFDCSCVLLAMPLLAPIILTVGAAVRLTSRGPVLFLQERVGRDGRIFTIFKFRTMIHAVDSAHHPITTSNNQRFTPIGPFLRQWKLDELPQLANVLFGQMSLVGPRPKLPEHVLSHIPCRPGITGMATIVFASEETALARIPMDYLNAYYHAVVLPAKCQLDIEYMSQATFLSDLGLLANSVLHRWDDTVLESFLHAAEVEYENERSPSLVSGPSRTIALRPSPMCSNSTAEAEQPSAF